MTNAHLIIPTGTQVVRVGKRFPGPRPANANGGRACASVSVDVSVDGLGDEPRPPTGCRG